MDKKMEEKERSEMKEIFLKKEKQRVPMPRN